MSLSINWATKVISIPQSYLTFIGGNTYELDVNQFRLDLKDIEDSEEGMAFLDTHRHNTEVDVGGITLSRVVELINGYTVTFEDGQYMVNLAGANNNISDATNLNQVSIRSANSAGLITVISGSGVTQQDKEDIASEVWQHTSGDQVVTDLDTPDQYKADLTNLTTIVEVIKKMQVNRLKIDSAVNKMIIYDDDGITPFVSFDLKNKEGSPTSENVYERVPT